MEPMLEQSLAGWGGGEPLYDLWGWGKQRRSGRGRSPSTRRGRGGGEEEEEDVKEEMKGKEGREEIGTRKLRRGSGWLSLKNPGLLISGLWVRVPRSM